MTTAVIAPSELLKRDDAARYLGLRPQTLAAWATSGRYGLPYVRVGRAVRYRRADLDKFLTDRTVSNTGEADALDS